MKKTVLLIVLLAGPAWGRGWEVVDPEGACDFWYARGLHQLDCAALSGAAESQRHVVNSRMYSIYQQGRSRPAAAPAATAPPSNESMTPPRAKPGS